MAIAFQSDAFQQSAFQLGEIFDADVIEALTGVDAGSSAQSSNASTQEITTANAQTSSINSLVSVLIENASALASDAVVGSFSSNLLDNFALADQVFPIGVFGIQTQDSSSASDAASTTASLNPSIFETSFVAGNVLSNAKFPVSIVESAQGVSIFSRSFFALSALSETAEASEETAILQKTAFQTNAFQSNAFQKGELVEVNIIENISPTDSTVSAIPLVSGVSDGAIFSDLLSTIGVFGIQTQESLVTLDLATSLGSFTHVVEDAATVSDTVLTTGNLNPVVQAAANVTDQSAEYRSAFGTVRNFTDVSGDPLTNVFAGGSVQESSEISGQTSTLISAQISVVEQVQSVDVPTITILVSTSVTESSSVIDSAAALRVLQGILQDSASGLYFTSAPFSFNSSVQEGTVVTLAVSSIGSLNPVVIDSAQAIDSMPTNVDIQLIIQESIVVIDELTARYLWELINTSETTAWELINTSETTAWGLIEARGPTIWSSISNYTNTE